VIGIAIFLLVALGIASLYFYMRAQKRETSVLVLLQQHRYAEAVSEADRALSSGTGDDATRLHRAEALKLIGNFAEAERGFREIVKRTADDAAAIESLALTLAHQRVDCEEARSLMNRAITSYPQIQEFQAISLAYVELRCGKDEEALRIFEDNRLLVATRFQDDYTDPDPLLAETLYIYASLLRRAGENEEAQKCFAAVANWAPGSIFAEWVTKGPA